MAECYYKHLTAYMQRLFTLTFERTKHDEEDVGLQAIEFWNTICETEGELIEDLEEAQENGEVPHICSATLQALERKAPFRCGAIDTKPMPVAPLCTHCPVFALNMRAAKDPSATARPRRSPIIRLST